MVIGEPSTLDRRMSDATRRTQIPVVDSNESCEYRGSTRDNLESALTDAVDDLDIVVVTGYLETT